jgi:type 1 glutamine amidotransferase
MKIQKNLEEKLKKEFIMNRLIGLFLSICLLVGFQSCKQNTPVKVLLITGEHDYDKENFEVMLGKLSMIYDHVEHPDAYAMLKADKIKDYDVVLLYDMPRNIPDEARKDLIAMLEKGKGLVVLHHAICSDDYWDEYVKIVGGRFHHYPWMKDGIEQLPSTFTLDVTMPIRVEDNNHPVTRGLSDFEIIDEVYGGIEILPTVHPLLSSNSELVCWTNTYGNSHVVAFILGHDKHAWENPAFIKTLSQAIVWAKK